MQRSNADVTVIAGGAVATVDASDTEYSDGHLVIQGNRIVAVGPGPAPTEWLRGAARVVDGRGTLTTPGLINTHHHLYQWITRGYAQDTGLF
ncbi:MAG: 8-oxoguanine deaminase, partial [Nakamurella sp.]